MDKNDDNQEYRCKPPVHGLYNIGIIINTCIYYAFVWIGHFEKKVFAILQQTVFAAEILISVVKTPQVLDVTSGDWIQNMVTGPVKTHASFSSSSRINNKYRNKNIYLSSHL